MAYIIIGKVLTMIVTHSQVLSKRAFISKEIGEFSYVSMYYIFYYNLSDHLNIINLILFFSKYIFQKYTKSLLSRAVFQKIYVVSCLVKLFQSSFPLNNEKFKSVKVVVPSLKLSFNMMAF